MTNKRDLLSHLQELRNIEMEENPRRFWEWIRKRFELKPRQWYKVKQVHVDEASFFLNWCVNKWESKYQSIINEHWFSKAWRIICDMQRWKKKTLTYDL
mgnify:CR=1 FL=1